MDGMFRQWAEWLAATPWSQYLQKQSWAIVSSQSIHIMCVAVVIGSVFMISLRVLGASSSGRKVSELVKTLTPWIYGALVVLLITGVEQTIAEPQRQLLAQPFRWKMAILALTVVLTVLFTRAVRARSAHWDDAAVRPVGARVFAVVWLALWIVIVYCGRFIGYAFVG